MISLIVAASTNNAIGKNNQLLWHLPNDLKFFKNTTWGGVVIMGRKTFESVNKPLPGRLNIVITSNKDWAAENVVTANSLEEALEKATAAHYKEIFIIGGGEIYRQSLAIANRIYLTRVHTQIDGDTFFPELNSGEWKLVSANECKSDEKNAFDHTIEVWEKI
ncbi:MAG: dihydrofolate reductase [Bacteroidota bacterium]